MKTSQTIRSERLRRRLSSSQAAALFVLCMPMFAGCTLMPPGLDAERAALLAAQPPSMAAQHAPAAAGELPVPADGNDWPTLVARAQLANGDVAAAWGDWAAALESVAAASAWPNTNVALNLSWRFPDGSVKTFDRLAMETGFDAMENLAMPAKTARDGRIALEAARIAGQRFREASFAVRRRVLDAWLDLALASERARLATEREGIAGIVTDVSDAALRGGSGQDASWSSRLASARAGDEAARAAADLEQARATLAAAAVFESPRDITTPLRLPAPRALPSIEGLQAALAVAPEVTRREAEAFAREHEEARARLEWIPDVNPFVGLVGAAEQMVGAMVVLPTTVTQIRSGIAAARVRLDGAHAALEQARRDRRGEVAALLAALADAERARRLVEEAFLPAAQSLEAATSAMWTAGRGELAALLDARLLSVDLRLERAGYAVGRERLAARLEEVLGRELETLGDGARCVAEASQSVPDPDSAQASRSRTDLNSGLPNRVAAVAAGETMP